MLGYDLVSRPLQGDFKKNFGNNIADMKGDSIKV